MPQICSIPTPFTHHSQWHAVVPPFVPAASFPHQCQLIPFFPPVIKASFLNKLFIYWWKHNTLPQAKPQRAASALTAVEHLEGRDAEFSGVFPGGAVTSVLSSSSLFCLQIYSGPCIYWLFSFWIRLIIASRFLINYVYITFCIECFQSLSSDGTVDHYHWSVLDSWLMFTDSHICLSLAHDTPHFKKHSEVQ